MNIGQSKRVCSPRFSLMLLLFKQLLFTIATW